MKSSSSIYAAIMHSSIVLLALSAFILGVSSYRFPRPQAILNRLRANHPHSKGIIYKRQTDTDECVEDELKSADVDSACRLSAQEEERLDFDDDLSQPSFDVVFREFCKPECGNAVLAAFIGCDAFEDEFIDLFAGLCGTNQNGEQCYQRFVRALDLFLTQNRAASLTPLLAVSVSANLSCPKQSTNRVAV